MAAPELWEIGKIIALVLFVEGVFLTLFPKLMQAGYREAAKMPEISLRLSGLGAVAIGWILLWLFAS